MVYEGGGLSLNEFIRQAKGINQKIHMIYK
jgi:hypothetical protein